MYRTLLKTSPNQRERLLAGQVRELSLNLVFKYLNDESDENKKFRQDLLLKLATNLLPRKNEVTGEDGEPIKLTVVKYGDTDSLSVPTEELST